LIAFAEIASTIAKASAPEKLRDAKALLSAATVCDSCAAAATALGRSVAIALWNAAVRTAS
jgi:hypothetical protein